MDVQQPASPTVELKGLDVLRAVSLWCSAFVSLGGFLFGYDTGSIGPVTVMPQFDAHFGAIAPAKHGLVVSCLLLNAAVFSLVAGPLADRISRTRTIALGALVLSAGETLCAAAPQHRLALFIVGRCIAGAGQGLFMSPITTYTCEIGPTAIRGRLTVTTQLFITAGILCGYFTCYSTVGFSGAAAWRVPYIVKVTIGAVLAVGCLFLPHSPRWLNHVGRDADCDKTLKLLGVGREEMGLDPVRPPVAGIVEDSEKAVGPAPVAAPPANNLKGTWAAMWRRDIRGRTILGVYLQAAVMCSGIDGLLYYSPIIFAQAGLSSTTASFLASGVVGLVNFLVTIPALIYSDHWGRRPPLIWGGVVISGSMLIMGILYATNATDFKAGQYAVIGLIFVFIIAFALSWAVVVRGYAVEIQPMQTRAASAALGQAANWIVNWTIAFTTPLFLAKSASGPYFLWGGCSLVMTVVCVRFAHESLGVSLEDLEKEYEARFLSSFARSESGRTSMTTNVQ